MRVGVISPYPEFTLLAQEVARELGVEVLIEEGILDEGVAIATRWDRERAVDAIVARGPTAILVRRAVSLPVSLITITGYDVLDALYRARRVGGPTALLDYARKAVKYDFDHLAALSGLEFKPFLYEDRLDVDRQFQQALDEGYTTIVGTGVCIVQMACDRSLQGILVHSSREAVTDAFRHAIDQFRAAEKEKARAQRTQAVLDVATDGIIAVDEKGVVVVFSRSAERLLGILAESVVPRRIKELERHPVLGPLLGRGDAVRAELVKVEGANLVVNRVPLSNGGLVITFQAASLIQSLEEKIRKQLHTKGLVARHAFRDLVGTSPAFRMAVERGRRFARTELTVMLTGKSGTGKELFAHAIHKESRRSNGPFVAVNCAALPESLLESELFGYEEGAFTGARKGGKPGLFELAHGGTIFLDEIGELSVGLQARLLRVLQQREVMRVGGDRLIPVDVRVLAATNRDLSEAVQSGRFREDLYYRLNVLDLHLPCLRERREDIALLARHFLHESERAMGTPILLPDAAVRLLEGYDWPGNVRELENFIQRFAVLSLTADDPTELVRDLMRDLGRRSRRELGGADTLVIELGTMEQMERQILKQMERRSGLDRAEMARFLGISRTTLWKKLKEAEQIQH